MRDEDERTWLDDAQDLGAWMVLLVVPVLVLAALTRVWWWAVG